MLLNSSGREFILNDQDQSIGPIIWWLQRDQRLFDNWTYLAAAEKAKQLDQPLVAVFCLSESFLGGLPRTFEFMLHGLYELQRELTDYSIPLLILRTDDIIEEASITQLADLANELKAGAMYTDFNPLRLVMSWKQQIASSLKCPLIEVDAHNIIPCRIASDKQEFAARTFRPKVNRQLELWLNEFPEPGRPTQRQTRFFLELNQQTDFSDNKTEVSDQRYSLKRLKYHYRSTRIFLDSIFSKRLSDNLPASGSNAAKRRLKNFINEGLNNYQKRNDPNEQVVSGLSPYLHFGQISAQRIALEVRKATGEDQDIKAAAAEFLEELIVRRELSDNFCFYNQNYDRFAGFPAWAQKTLKEHENDLRPHNYSSEQLESGETHDELWNTAQLNMVRTGSMPGYLRMYWAKKILEWTISPEEALSITIGLNDRYMLDGRDPNGYTGVAWSIGGVHDRPWVERPVFGKIRLMTLSGCRRKFDVDAWIRSHS